MSAIMLTAREERKAVLVPCYGFQTREDAQPHLETLTDLAYLPFAQCGRPRLYVPNTPPWTTSCEVNEFLDMDARRPVWNTLRAAETPMPAGAYNVALVVNGPRQFYHHVRASTRMPSWLQRMSEGWRDCYVTWNCVEEKRHVFYDMATDKSLYLVRSARGVIYAVAPTYDHSGNLEQIRRLVVCVEFRILDKKPEKGDVMRVSASRRNYYDDPAAGGASIAADYDDDWRTLVERAKRGYDQHCQLLPPKEEDWRSMVAAVYSYLPNVIAAVLILLVAAAVSAAVSGLLAKVMGDTATGKMVAGIVPGVIFSIAIFMALNQLQIATEIVTITYAAIIGAVALGAALAFGLGGRDVAAQMLQQAQFKAQEHAAQVRQDLATGKERSRALASDAKQSLQGQEQAEEQPQTQPGFMPAPGFGESTESFKDLPPKKRP